MRKGLIILIMAAFAGICGGPARGQDSERPGMGEKQQTESRFIRFARKNEADLKAERITLVEILISFARGEYRIERESVEKEFNVLLTRFQSEIAELKKRRKAKGEANPSAEERIRLLYKFLFDDMGFRYKEDFTDLAKISINKILEHREGNSLGLGLLILALTENLTEEYAIPVLEGAWAGDHFVLTYMSNSKEKRFLEPDEKGLDRSVKSYRHLPEEAIDSGAYLSPLGKEELVGLICYARAKILIHERKKVEELGYSETAEQYLDLAVARNVRLAEARLLLSQILIARLEKDGYRRARIHLDAACKLNPLSAKAFHLRGIAHYNIGEIASATSDFGKALKLNPETHEALFYLARIARDEGKTDLARERFKTFYEKSGDALKDLREQAQYAIREIDASEPLEILIDESKPYQSRIKAAKSLGKLKVRSSIAPLIDVLTDENIRFRYFCAKVLSEVTGKDFGVDQTRWRTWWNSQKSGEYR